MTVAELIRWLEKQPQNYTIYLSTEQALVELRKDNLKEELWGIVIR